MSLRNMFRKAAVLVISLTMIFTTMVSAGAYAESKASGTESSDPTAEETLRDIAEAVRDSGEFFLGVSSAKTDEGGSYFLRIARAIAPKPKLLIFDEATSALDNKTQKEVSDSLDKMGCTRIVIAHRLSTIKNCDRILVLDNGSIAEDGTYEELIAKGGIFADLVRRQRL